MLLVINNTMAKNVWQTRATSRLLKWLHTQTVPHTVLSTVAKLHDYIVHHGHGVTGIVLTGSDARFTQCVCDELKEMTQTVLLRCTVPVLGICFGFQGLALAYGGAVDTLPRLRQGVVRIHGTADRLPMCMDVVQHHHDYVSALPQGWLLLAASTMQGVHIPEMAKHPTMPIWGVQFHPELSGSVGEDMLRAFVARTMTE